MTVPAAKIWFPEEDRQQILADIDEALQSGVLTLGPYTKAFEEEFAAAHGMAHAVAVNSGTSAIEIPLHILGVQGREVIVPTNTFFATPAAVLHAGGRVRFVDVDPATFSISLESVRAAIRPDTAGVIVVHIAGIVTPQIRAIRDLCAQRGLFLFEDAAHAQHSTLDGQCAGTFGDAASFSFYPTKVMTSAEGGMIVTNQLHIDEEARIFRDQGKAGFTSNFHTRLGYNWRLSEVHAAIGRSQLRRLDEFVRARQRVAHVYDQALSGADCIQAVPLPPGVCSNYYKYLALLAPGIDRAVLKSRLREQGVNLSGEVYDTPCHKQPIFAGWAMGDFPNADDLCSRDVCLPIFPQMTDKQAVHVADVLVRTIHSG